MLDRIRAGEYEWELRLAPAIGVSASEEAAAEMSRAALVRKDFLLHVQRTPAEQLKIDPHRIQRRTITKQLLANDVGQRIESARQYEEALAARGGARSVLFAEGNLDDWGQVAAESTWAALAFDFHRAATIVGDSHRPESPAPTLALLQLCRHSLELELKTIIDAGRRLAGITPNVHATHKLMLLWPDALPLIKASWGPEVWSDDEAERVKAIVQAFEEIDSTAMTTRYPLDLVGNMYERPATLLNFSVKKMMAEYETAVQFFGSAHLWIEVRRRIQEMEKEDAERQARSPALNGEEGDEDDEDDLE
ncbi:MAG: hypothetical protein H0T46_06440 [Deltaproteobacteria bacterium]|nr:hypothetical protein [Deltaproteobacteria bacterium]